MVCVDKLNCSYGKVDVLHNVSFNVNENEILCILGANGSGKSTILKSISHIIDSSGKITIDGVDIKNLKRNVLSKKVTMMSQITNMAFSYTVYETVKMGRYVHKNNKGINSYTKEDELIVVDSLKKTGVYELKNKMITQLSGGQLQRVFLSRIFAQNPDVILLDEPTNHLDIKYQIELMDNIKSWVQEKRRCVIGVLHDINLAMAYSNKILLLDNGKVIANDTTNNFDTELMSDVYGFDIKSYMRKTLSIWE